MAIQLNIMCVDLDLGGDPVSKSFVKTEISVGRARESDFVLDNPSVSAKHAKLRIDAGNGNGPEIYITDLQSTNGTLVGGKRLPPGFEMLTSTKDRIVIGNCLLRLEMVEVSEEAAERFEDEESDEEAAPSSPSQMATTQTMSREELAASAFFANPESEEEDDEEEEVESAEEQRPFQPQAMFEAVAAEMQPDALGSFVFRDLKVEENSDDDVEEFADPADELLAVGNHDRVEEVHEDDDDDGLFLDGENVEGFDFEGIRLYSLSVSADRREKPLSGVYVLVDGMVIGETDGTGSFTAEGFEEDHPVTVEFRKDGFVCTPSIQRLTATEEMNVHVTAVKLCAVRGRVMHKGQPVQGVRIVCDGVGETVTDAQGRYEFSNLPEGMRYTLKAEKEGYSFGSIPARAS